MTHLSYSTQKSQQGATLIIVLMLLLMISIIGVIALKQSGTDLKLATSDQINTLLLQSSDSSVQRLEDIVNGNEGAPMKDSELIIDVPTGAFGHFILDEEGTKGDIYTYCFDPLTTYLVTSPTLAKPDNTGKIVKEVDKQHGSCVDKTGFRYTTDLNAVITQVSIRPKNFNKGVDKAFAQHQVGQNAEDKSSKKHPFNIYSTSAIPTYGKKMEESEYNDHYFNPKEFKKYLKEKNVPHTAVYEEAIVEEERVSDKCIDYGKGSFNANCGKKSKKKS